MKRYLIIGLLLLTTLLSSAFAAPQPRWLALNPISDNAELFGSDFKSSGTLKIGPRPFSIQALPDQTGYALLYLGSTKTFGGMKDPGGILYLDAALKPTAKKISFTGVVIDQFYHQELQTWFIFTGTRDSGKTTNNTLNIVNLNQGSLQSVALKSEPSVYKFNGQNLLAVATIGDAETQIKPELVLVNLASMATEHYPLTANPGAIFFKDDNQLLVACGGYREGQKLFTFFSDTTTEKPSEPAQLHLIEIQSKSIKSLPVGYAPLAIVQDQVDKNNFFLTSNTEPNPEKPSGMLQVLSGDQITSTVKFATEPVFLIQASSGNLCVLGRNTFFLIHPEQSKILTESRYEMEIDSLHVSRDGKTGYITNINSNYVDAIQLETGERLAKFKIGKNSLLGNFSLGKILPKSYPPVIGMNERLQLSTANVSVNTRMILTENTNLMYVLAGNSQIDMVDTTTYAVKRSIPLNGNPYGIHLTPNGKYIVASTDTHWYLLDPNQNKPVLSILITDDEIKKAPQTAYYSPDGNLLILPFENTLYIIDTVQGKLAGKVKTKLPNPLITWLP